MTHHMSAVMLATLGSALLNEVKDADERAAVVQRVAVLLNFDEGAGLSAMAGLPKYRGIPRPPEQSIQTSSWQPISTAPQHRAVLLFNGFVQLGDWADYCVYNSPNFTHWMEMPEPPK